MEVNTVEDAFNVYFASGEDLQQPSWSCSYYDEERGGWVLTNMHGVLALVLDNETIVEPVYDPESYPSWVLPEDE